MQNRYRKRESRLPSSGESPRDRQRNYRAAAGRCSHAGACTEREAKHQFLLSGLPCWIQSSLSVWSILFKSKIYPNIPHSKGKFSSSQRAVRKDYLENGTRIVISWKGLNYLRYPEALGEDSTHGKRTCLHPNLRESNGKMEEEIERIF